MTMQPTMKLRFVERNVFPEQPTHLVFKNILQQWWAEGTVNLGFGNIETGRGEWRDVPVEEDV